VPDILTITLMIVALGVVGLSAEHKERRTQSNMLVLAPVTLILFGPLAFTR